MNNHILNDDVTEHILKFLACCSQCSSTNTTGEVCSYCGVCEECNRAMMSSIVIGTKQMMLCRDCSRSSRYPQFMYFENT
jgi:hypothetical protein